ncbi:ABC transporter ATP-binding protein [Paenibacillus alkalitolerans]|uniref:ABC transporter ATP-binding protein n=1 Tax=Paenibacillus alkalitolerans TaxID=2799335 RepID=UPI0018F6633D|nr:ABC transporter ATP-binding protein [Paenibacillus alkalitolerans]
MKMIRKLLIFGFVIKIFHTGSHLMLTGIQKYIIDDMFMKQQFELLIPLISAFAGAILAALVFGGLSRLILDSNALLLNRIITRDMIEATHRLPVEKIQSKRTGELVNYLTNDVKHATNTISSFTPEGLSHFVTFTSLCFIIGYSSPLILVSILLLSVLYIVFGKYFAPRMKKTSKQVQESKSALMVQIEEGISSTREVIAYDRTQWEIERLNHRFSQYFDNVMRLWRWQIKSTLSTEPIRWAASLIIFAVGGYQVMQGNISVGLFVIVYQFSNQLITAAQGLYNFVTNFSTRLAAVERIRNVMEEQVQKDGNEAIDAEVRKFSLEHVRFRYSPELPCVFEDLCIDLPLGKKVAFVGTSGGGKSTLAKLFIRFHDPEVGAIMINGIPLSKIKREDWTKKISIVFQEPYLFPDTIRSNLLLGRENISEKEMIAACKAVCIHDMIEALEDGYDAQVGERGIQLSGGQRQRLALARALLSNSEILILDEATSALDLETERQVQANLDEWRKGKTTIIIAHRLTTITNADWIYVLKDGSVAEQGTHEQLLANRSIYQELVTTQYTLEEKGA